jgi:hypothetical protein
MRVTVPVCRGTGDLCGTVGFPKDRVHNMLSRQWCGDERRAPQRKEVGDDAPDFALPATGLTAGKGQKGAKISLSDYHGQKNVVLANPPRALNPRGVPRDHSFGKAGDNVLQKRILMDAIELVQQHLQPGEIVVRDYGA